MGPHAQGWAQTGATPAAGAKGQWDDTSAWPQVLEGSVLATLIGSTWVLYDEARGPRARWGTEARVALIGGSAVLGAGLGAWLWSVRPVAPARAAFPPSLALWTGAATGLLVAGLTSNEARRDEFGLFGAALALEAGAVAGTALARWTQPSGREVMALHVGAAAGGALVGGAAWGLEGFRAPGEAQLLWVGAAAGIVAGGLLAWLWQRR